MERTTIRRALLSVSDKTELVSLAKTLVSYGVELISTGGTKAAIAAAGLPVMDISEFTGFPEMLDGRVKTLHPKVHGGLLHRRDIPEHLATAAAHGIKAIDLLVVNLYPFEATVAKPGVSLAEAIENIDIGGPAMIRSAAKNSSHVAVVTDPSQYRPLLAEMQQHGGAVTAAFMAKLATAAFARTARYDRAIHDFFAKQDSPDENFPEQIETHFSLQQKLRYGENPHQPAALYKDPTWIGASVVSAKQLHGKELSYNNFLDLDSALAMVREFSLPAVAIIKHNNPCGAAVAEQLATAFANAWAGDPLSAFGSVIGINREVDEATAQLLVEPGRFVEAIIAPSFSPAAFQFITTIPTWKANVRLLAVGHLAEAADARAQTPVNRPIEGGMLRQMPDLGENGFRNAKVVTQKSPSPQQLRDLEFAWQLVKHVRSNAIVLASDGAAVGVGAGQMSRVDAGRIAIEKAGKRALGSVLASDAFFPFDDNVEQAAAAGISAIIQPGGSKRDQDSIDACNRLGLAMLFTGTRHFRH